MRSASNPPMLPITASRKPGRQTGNSAHASSANGYRPRRAISLDGQGRTERSAPRLAHQSGGAARAIAIIDCSNAIKGFRVSSKIRPSNSLASGQINHRPLMLPPHRRKPYTIPSSSRHQAGLSWSSLPGLCIEYPPVQERRAPVSGGRGFFFQPAVSLCVARAARSSKSRPEPAHCLPLLRRTLPSWRRGTRLWSAPAPQPLHRPDHRPRRESDPYLRRGRQDHAPTAPIP